MLFPLAFSSSVLADYHLRVTPETAAENNVSISSRRVNEDNSFCYGGHVFHVSLPKEHKNEKLLRATLQVLGDNQKSVVLFASLAINDHEKPSLVCISKTLSSEAYIVAEYGESLCIVNGVISVKLIEFADKEP